MTMKKYITLILILVSLESFAQVDGFLESREYRNGYISFATIKQNKAVKVAWSKEATKRELTGNRSDISLLKTISGNPLKKQQENTLGELSSIQKCASVQLLLLPAF